VIATTLLVAVGCGGHVDTVGHGGGESGANGSGGTTGVNGAGGALAGDSASDSDKAAACEHLFLAIYSTRCGGAGLEPGEAMRELPLFQSDCLAQFSLPGNGVAASALEACASAMEIAACNPGPLLECDFRGTLPGGAACSAPNQCNSGFCDMGAVGPGGGSLPFNCGHCSEAVDIGGDCSQGECVAGASCVSHDLAPSCVAIHVGAEGDQCDDLTVLCPNDLYCSGRSQTCVPLGALGNPCGSRWITGCVAPNYCDGSPGNCRALGDAGADCSLGQLCGPGLLCDATTKMCTAVQWTEPGQPCGTGVHICRMGQCLGSSSGVQGPVGVCPFIAALGEPCDDVKTACDMGAICYHGTCVGAHSVACK
jgi:hypothetical protein